MKKSSLRLFQLISVVVIASTPLAASAQYLLGSKPDQPSAWIGFRLGTSIASENLSALPGGASTGLKFGFTGGLDLEYWFTDEVSIRTGLLWMQKGIDENYAPSSVERVEAGNDNFSLNYFEVPVLAKIAFGYGDARPFFCAGPSFGFLASASETTDGTIPTITDLKSDLNNLDISIYFGGGVLDRIPRGPAITLDAGYETGLSKIFKTSPVRPFDQPIGQTTATSSEIVVTVGAMWGL